MALDEAQLHFDEASLVWLQICLGVIMFGIALDLRWSHFQKLIDEPRSTVIGLSSQFLLLPLLTFLLVIWLRPQASIALGMFLVAACPGGNISNFLSHFARGETALSVGLSGLATLLSLLLTPLNFELYAHWYAPSDSLLREISLDPKQVIRTILLILALPLVLGMLVNRTWPRWSTRASPVFRALSILIFTGFIGIALIQNFDLFKAHIHRVAGLVFLHNALALAAGYYWTSLFLKRNSARRTIALETGIQNSGLGLVLIFSFFQGIGGMAITAAWWGIWHIVTGLGLALFWRRDLKGKTATAQ